MESQHQTLQRSTSIETSDVGERVVLYHRKTGKSLVLNPSGTWLWRQMDAPLTPEALAQRLQSRFPALDAETARRDVENYLNALAEHEAILKTA